MAYSRIQSWGCDCCRGEPDVADSASLPWTGLRPVRFAWMLARLKSYLALSACLTVTLCQLLVLFEIENVALSITFRVLFWIFVATCATMFFPKARPDFQIVYQGLWRKLMLNGVAALWIVYTVILILDNLHTSFIGQNLGFSSERVKRLWSSSAYMWAFAAEWVFWSLNARSLARGSASHERRTNHP